MAAGRGPCRLLSLLPLAHLHPLSLLSILRWASTSFFFFLSTDCLELWLFNTVETVFYYYIQF